MGGRVGTVARRPPSFLLAFDSLAGFLLYTSLLRSTPLGLVGTYAYVTPLIAVAIGVIALGDTVSARRGARAPPWRWRR